MKESEDDGEKMSQGQEANDRVDRNDRLSQGSSESRLWRNVRVERVKRQVKERK